MNDSSDPGRLPDLDKLPLETQPPAELQHRVLGTLRSEGLIGRSPSRPASRWLAAAACLAAMLLGWTARGLVLDAGPDRLATSGDYLILLAEPEPLRTSKSMDALVAEYSAWARQLASEERLVTAGHLVGESTRLEPEWVAEAAPDSAVPLDSLTGFFVVRAEDLEHASEIAATSPHVGYGGRIAVRSIE